MLRNRLPKPFLCLFSTIVSILLVPRSLSLKLKKAIDDWSEMAPYRIRSMAMNFDSTSATGLSSLKPGHPCPNDYPDEFTRRAMKIWSFVDSDRRLFGKTSVVTAQQWMRLADLYREYGQIGDALIFYRRGLAIFRLNCEATDDRLIAARKTLADFYLNMGSPAEAETLLKEIAEAITAKLSAIEAGSLASDKKKQPSVEAKNSASALKASLVETLLILSESLKEQGKYAEAAEVLNRVVDFYERPLPTSDECVGVYRELASIYNELGDELKAALFLATAQKLSFVMIMTKCVGDASSLIVELERLAELYRQQEKSHIVRELEMRIEVCQLSAKVSGAVYPGVEEDLGLLAQHLDRRNEPGDANTAFHLRARAKRIVEATARQRIAPRTS